MTALLTVAQLTLLEARRRRILLAALICGLGFIAVFATGLFFAERDLRASGGTPINYAFMFTFFTAAGLYAANFLTVMLAVILPCDTLSGEIASGVMQTLASKPVRRSEILLGKWLAYWSITAAYLLLIVGGIFLALRVIGGYAPQNPGRAVPAMLLEVTVLLTVSIAGGTRFTTITNGIIGFGFYGIAFVGGWVEQIGALTGTTAARNIGTVVSLLSPTDVMWRLAIYYVLPPMVRDLQNTPFTTAAVPNAAMVVWAVGFAVVILLIALRQFERRPL